MTRDSHRATIFGPHPILTVTVEASADGAQDEVHLHAGGQGVWVGRMVAEMGVEPVLCGFLGGEVGASLGPLLTALPGRRRLVPAAGNSGCCVMDRRSGERQAVAVAWTAPASRHEIDDLFSITCAEALLSDVLVVCNPMSGNALPRGIYGDLIADVRANGTPVVVDLSSPRLDSALAGGPDLVKVNDWELAEFVRGPVGEPPQRRAAVEKLRAAGARSVIVTRAAEPAYAVRADGEEFELVPPRFDRGAREGCGDAMTGAMAAGWALGLEWLDVLILGTAAGSANFLRHGLGTGSKAVVDELVGQVHVRSAQA